MGKLQIKIVYCGAWGYGPKFRSLAKDLEQMFPNQLEFIGEPTPSRTGWFEVSIVGVALIHSKKRGDGYVDKPEKRKKIVDAISAALAAQQVAAAD